MSAPLTFMLATRTPGTCRRIVHGSRVVGIVSSSLRSNVAPVSVSRLSRAGDSAADGDGLLGSRHRQRHRQDRVASECDVDVAADRREPGALERQGVLAGRQVEETEVSVEIRGRRLRRAGTL